MASSRQQVPALWCPLALPVLTLANFRHSVGLLQSR